MPASNVSTVDFVDTHTHVYDPDFSGKMLMVSTFLGKKNSLYDGDEDGAEQVLAVAKQHDNVGAILGIYPEFAYDLEIPGAMQSLRDLVLTSREKVAGIGEIGLDYHCEPTATEKDLQQKLFRAQLELAVELDLPVSLHIRDLCPDDSADAFEDAFRILADFPKTRAVCHSFTGSQASLDKALELGFYVSVNGIYTFNRDQKLQAALNSVPLERLLLETDAPFLTPAPYRKEKNKSSFIPVIAESVAKSRGITVGEVARATTKNAQKLFDI
jgi:TatD DNase family protein